MATTLNDKLAKQGVPWSKVLGLSTDGVSAMTGQNKGLAGILKRENLHIINVHCIAHRSALCTCQAAESVPPMKDYVETLTSLFYYFKASSLRAQKLEHIQEILDSDKWRLKEVHEVRWLSFFDALQTVHRSLVPLLDYLESGEATSRSKDPKAVGLRKKVS